MFVLQGFCLFCFSFSPSLFFCCVCLQVCGRGRGWLLLSAADEAHLIHSAHHLAHKGLVFTPLLCQIIPLPLVVIRRVSCGSCGFSVFLSFFSFLVGFLCSLVFSPVHRSTCVPRCSWRTCLVVFFTGWPACFHLSFFGVWTLKSFLLS